jgi:acetyltransferase-like isoleucine patch superfamily enzyme
MQFRQLLLKFRNAWDKAVSGQTANELGIHRLRKLGVKIGRDCVIHTKDFSTEPYLVEIGDRVGIAGGTRFLAHDGAAWLVRDRHPDLHVLGRITVGSGTFIGQDCLILPGTTIGRNCLIGAGSVVKGAIPDESVVLGNPARVVMKTGVVERLLLANKGRIDADLAAMKPADRKRLILGHFARQKDLNSTSDS